jgi:hypothetical protein
VSVRWGPHLLQQFNAEGEALEKKTTKRRGKGGTVEGGANQTQVSTASHSSLEISPTTRDSHFPTAPTTAVVAVKGNRKTKAARAA